MVNISNNFKFRHGLFVKSGQNLQSEGHGISGFQTMLSIGLGQEQQFSATCCIMKSYTVKKRTNISMYEMTYENVEAYTMSYGMQ